MQTGGLAKLQRHLSEPRGQAVLVFLVLVVSLIVRLLLFRVEGCWGDLEVFKWWFNTAADGGLPAFYDNAWSDYPPLNIYIFWVFGKLAHALGPDSLPFIIKLPGNLFDLATAFLIFRFLRPRFSFKVSLAVMAIYAFNPATIFDLAVWGQMDSIYTFFMVASLYSALRSKFELSGGLLALAILTKPQSIVLLPVIAYVMWRNGDWRRVLCSSAVFGAVVFLVILPFNWDNPIAFVLDRYISDEAGYNLYPFNSAHAYNFWALLGFWKSDTIPHLGLTYQQWGGLAFGAFAAFVMWQLHHRYEPRSAIFAVFLLMFGFFMLMTRMHERYLFAVFALLALGWYTRFTIWIYIGLTATYLANLVYVMSILNTGVSIPDGHWSIYVLAPANIILFGLSIWTFYRMQRAKPPQEEAQPPPQLPAPDEIKEQPPPPARRGMKLWSAPVGVAILAIIYFSVSVWNLGDLRAPSSDFVPQNDPEEVYLDLGETTRVDDVFLLLQDASTVDIELYQGSPESWTHVTSERWSGAAHRQWQRLALGQETRYVRFLFKGASGRIGEVALLADNQKLDIAAAMGDRGEEASRALIDEQDLFSHPLSHKSGTYFDEIYFVRAAEEHLKLEDPYGERTHPPMNKLIIAASIKVFGHNPFAWRIAGVIFATLMILLIYDFARRMFNSPRAGLIAAFLLTFGFMHFTQARLATGETFILFFVMAMFYFFYRYWQDPSRGGKYLFLSLVFFGLGFSTKWVVMWSFVGLVLLLLVLKWRKPIHRNEVLWFVGGLGTAVAIYMLSYIPYFLAGYDLGGFWDHQLFMFDFHSGLTATHPYSSEWYTWPVMLKPLYIFLGSFGDTTAYISSMGNPALWWAGIPAMIATLWLAVRHRNKTAIFIVIPFLTQWLIFIAIGRVLFIYHFYPNVLFMILAITLCIERLWNRYGWGKWAIAGYLALNVACFALFFPAISGLPMSNGYWEWLSGIRDWITRGWIT